MELAVGSIMTGKVTGITKFGAFVNLGPGKSGLVHISEIADTYVNDINEFLTVGQEVNVKVVNIDDSGRINLSIKAAKPKPERSESPAPKKQFERASAPRQQSNHPGSRQHAEHAAPKPTAETSFEDKLRRFMQDSDSKMSGLRQYTDQKSRRRGR